MDDSRSFMPASYGYAPHPMYENQFLLPATTNNQADPPHLQPGAMDMDFVRDAVQDIARGVAQGYKQGMSAGLSQGILQGIRKQKKLEKRRRATKESKMLSWDPRVPCCECGSHIHQLVGHPNPNTAEGILRGCLACNTLGHSFAECTRFKPGRKPRQLYYYYRVLREGLCPGEYHGDFREIPDKAGNYTLQHLPLTEEFAVENLYDDEINCQYPGKDADRKILKVDPAWEGEEGWTYLGWHSQDSARCPADALELWVSDENARHEKIRQNITKQYFDQCPTAPCVFQLANFSARHFLPTKFWTASTVRKWVDDQGLKETTAECDPSRRWHARGAVIDPIDDFPCRTATISRPYSSSFYHSQRGTVVGYNYTEPEDKDEIASKFGDKPPSDSTEAFALREFEIRDKTLAQATSLLVYRRQPAHDGFECNRHPDWANISL